MEEIEKESRVSFNINRFFFVFFMAHILLFVLSNVVLHGASLALSLLWRICNVASVDHSNKLSTLVHCAVCVASISCFFSVFLLCCRQSFRPRYFISVCSAQTQLCVRCDLLLPLSYILTLCRTVCYCEFMRAVNTSAVNSNKRSCVLMQRLNYSNTEAKMKHVKGFLLEKGHSLQSE